MRKKIILFIVEGPSDEIALGSVFINLFSNDKVLIDVIHGDITSDNNITPSNIMGKLGDNIRNYLKLKGLGKTDLQRVIHIVDIDGAYIEDSSVIQDDNCQKIRYTTQSIFTAHKDKIIERNSKKRANLDYISTKDTIFTKIPYQVFYMSSNLDHVLYNELNSIDIDKRNNAYKFAEKYKNNLPQFKIYLCNSPFSVINTYEKSWDFIKQDNHSLERFTNLGILLDSIN